MRKELKLLKKLLKLTPEQEEAFNEFYRELPAEPFKTFQTQEDFQEYIDGSLSEIKDKHQKALQELQNKMNETKINNVIASLTSDEKQKTILLKMTDLEQVDMSKDEEIKKAFLKTIEEFPEQLKTKKSVFDPSASASTLNNGVSDPNVDLESDEAFAEVIKALNI